MTDLPTERPHRTEGRPPARPPSAPGPRRRRPDEYVAIRPPSTAGRRVVVFVLGVAMVLAIVAGGVLVWAMQQVDPGDPGPQLSSVVIPSGSGVDDIGELLESKGVITSARVFSWYARWNDKGADWKAGEYTTFRKNSKMEDVVEVLDAGPVPPDSTALTIVPGTRLSQQLAAINKAFPSISVQELELRLAGGQVKSKYHPAGQVSWEGMLAADTFTFDEDATAVEILQRLADQQVKVLDGLGYERAEALTGHSAWDLITIASLAERETGAPADERGKIARVVLNRLERGEPLGIDAAILYGLGRTSGALTKSDLEKDTPYNNRLHKGLPPTPIATPSKAALEAAINPPEGPWIYYVLIENDPPTHLFTASAKEFERAKDDAKARGVLSGRPPQTGRTQLAGVVGWPARHSLSPAIFSAACEATGVDLAYVAFEVPPDRLGAAVAGAAALGVIGLNVTMPHKEAVLAFVDELTPVAERLQAVNCISRDGDRWVGDSTDGDGFVAALAADGIELRQRRVAVVGAGGAARSIVAAVAVAGAAEVTVVNRTPERGAAAAALAGPVGRVGAPGDVASVDLVVNATPVGMGDDGGLPLDPALLGPGQVVVDTVYHPLRTPLLAAAESAGARAIDGLGMLVGQAAIAFERWTGAVAPREVLRAAALAQLRSA